MNWNIASFLRRLRRDESGAVMVLVAVSIVALLLLTALAVDIGTLIYAQRRLQATTDMAALSGAAAYPCDYLTYTCPSMVSTATAYSAATGDQNAQSGLNVTMAAGYPKTYCLTSTGISCPTSGPNDGANAVEVQQQATVPLSFGSFLGQSPVTLTASSLASAKGGALPPMNIMLVLDNTTSMNNKDPDGVTCGGIANATRIQCALAGVQILLGELWPSQDQVGMMVFPGLYQSRSGCSSGACTPTDTSAANDISCSSSAKSICDYTGSGSGCDIEIVPYSAGPNYLLTATQSNNYCTAVSKGSCGGASQALSTSTAGVVTASCQSGMTVGSTSCGTCAGDKVKGGEGTYYAEAITAAQAQLVATQTTGICATLNCQNVIMLLSDGGAGNAGTAATLATSAATPQGGTVLTFTTSVPAGVIPGSSGTTVADTTSPDTTTIPAGTYVVSISGDTVTLSNAVVGAVTYPTTAATPLGTAVLTFASTTNVTAGMSVSDLTNPCDIPSGTTVKSTTATTVTISNDVTCGTELTTNHATTNSPNLFFGTSVQNVMVGMSVSDITTPSDIPSGTTVTAVTDVTDAVTLSTNVTVASGHLISFGGVPSGDSISFGGVAKGDTITFSSNNQCNKAITAAQTAAAAGTWVYSIAYGSSKAPAPNSASCSDQEPGPPIANVSSCATMQNIASDPSKFYSDPMGGSCTSASNPNYTTISQIFKNIGLNLLYTQLLPVGTQ